MTENEPETGQNQFFGQSLQKFEEKKNFSLKFSLNVRRSANPKIHMSKNKIRPLVHKGKFGFWLADPIFGLADPIWFSDYM